MKKTRQEQRLAKIASIIADWRDVPNKGLLTKAQEVNNRDGWTFDIRYSEADYTSEDQWHRVKGIMLTADELHTAVELAKRVRAELRQFLGERKGLTMTYRTVVYVSPTNDETVLTSREEAHLPDAELVEAAMREARDAGLIGDEWPRVPEAEFRSRLQIAEIEEA